jgi:hypothetical protein
MSCIPLEVNQPFGEHVTWLEEQAKQEASMKQAANRALLTAKCHLTFNGLHCFISVKKEQFISTALRTLNPI